MTLKLRHFLILTALIAPEALGQVAVLPRGVGLIQYSYRNMGAQVDFFNGDGKLENYSNANDQKIGLKSIMDKTSIGKSMGALGNNSALNELNVADIDISVEGNVNANVFAIGYGITDFLTAYIGIPYITAEVESTIAVKVNPELLELKSSVSQFLPGNLGEKFNNYKMITPERVREQLAKEGYTLNDKWSHSGVGDIQMGFKSAFNQRLMRSVLFNMGMGLDYRHPTGYVEDPNILNDSTLSEGGEGGYAGLTTSIQPGFVFARQFYLGADLGYRMNFSTTLDKRVPVAEEALPEQNRLTQVDIDPGSTKIARLNSKYMIDKFFAGYYLGYTGHERDDMSGPIAGNYDFLEAKTERWQVYQGMQLGMQTVKAYESKQFPIPLELTLGYHFTSSGINANNDSYYSLTMTTFFPTPFMRKPSRRTH